MFFSKSKSSGTKQAHFYKHQDWERGLDDLFMRCIHEFRHGLALYSDTARENSEDAKGHPIPELTRRLKQGLDSDLASALRKVNRDDFDALLKLEKENKPTFFDFYKVSKTALPNNALVNFIHGEKRNAILVFSPMQAQKELLQVIEKINAIVDSPEHGQ
jgi:hypothetical protein